MTRKSLRVTPADLDELKRQSVVQLALDSNTASAELLKWTLGALFLANGGALVALLGSEDLVVPAFKRAAIYFCLGLVLAIMGGMTWCSAQGLLSRDQFKRAWNPEPLATAEALDNEMLPVTKNWVVAAAIAWIGSVVLFVMGCAAMTFVPDDVAWDKLIQADHEASYRFKRANAEIVRLMKDPAATSAQRLAAQERMEMAYTEREIAGERIRRALGGAGDGLK